MTRIIADEGLKVRLKDFSESLEIRDEADGPSASSSRGGPRPSIYDWARPEFTEARKSREPDAIPPSYTTAEVLEHLRNL